MNREQLENYLKETYPVGSKVRCIHMTDPYSPVPSGTIGEVTGAVVLPDPNGLCGMLYVKWETNSSLNLVYGEDQFEKVI